MLQSQSWHRSANIVTDAHVSYEGLDRHFHSHHVVDHSQTFVRGVIVHTNFAESYHSLLKRGIIDAFDHVSDKHLCAISPNLIAGGTAARNVTALAQPTLSPPQLESGFVIPTL